MALREGERVPDVRLRLLRSDADRKAAAAPDTWVVMGSRQFFAARSVVLFALPGAFTPTCSSQHLPRYDQLAPGLFANGVDEVVCLAVNDPFVLERWASAQRLRRVTLAADGLCEFTDAVDMAVDLKEPGLGRRSRRYSMLVRDGVVEKLFVEPQDTGESDPYRVSDADTMLRHLNPSTPIPPSVVMLSREGCPHCLRARDMLDEAGIEYVDLPLDDGVRTVVLLALAGMPTAPQIFMDGRLVGGEAELEQHLHGPGGWEASKTAG